jgi:predicted secreted Zn-dependent protease
MAETLSVNELVGAYRKLRDAIAEHEEAHANTIKELRDKLELVTDELLTVCNEQDMDSIRTPSGTVSRRVQTRYWTNDWGAMYGFIEEHGAMHLLQKRLHNENVKQFLEENPDVLPAGLQAERKFVISVRKPTAK